MQPVGLTLKFTNKRYAQTSSGELMLVHHCNECAKISINRIAADDIPEVIMEVFDFSISLPIERREQIQKNGIKLLGGKNIDQVYQQLYGQTFKPELAAIPL